MSVLNFVRDVVTALRSRLAARLARRTSRLNLSQSPGVRILVMCQGNIYRSPFVAERLRELGGESLTVRSAGFHPVGNRPSPDRHQAMCRRLGVDLAGHRSRVVSDEDLAWADLVILMDRRNWVQLRARGVSGRKLVWLGAMSGGAVEIPDPYAMGDAAAEGVLSRLSEAVQRLAAALVRRHSLQSGERVGVEKAVNGLMGKKKI